MPGFTVTSPDGHRTKVEATRYTVERPHQSTTGQTVTRKVDSTGGSSFAGANYKAGMPNRGRQVQVAIVDDTIEIPAGGELIRIHAIKHDRSREHGAFANAAGRPSRTQPRPGTHLPTACKS